jgi:hypothetical protein
MEKRPGETPRVLIAPGESVPEALAAIVRGGLSELDSPADFVLAEPVPALAVASALAHYERQGEDLAAAAAIVHGSGDATLAATVSLVKLGIPVARLEDADAAANDLPGLLADHRLAPGDGLQQEVAAWLRRILPA